MLVTTRKISIMSIKLKLVKPSYNKYDQKSNLKFTIKKSEFNYRDMYPKLIVNLKRNRKEHYVFTTRPYLCKTYAFRTNR